MKKSTKEEIRKLAEEDLETFILLVHPQRVLGQVHKDLCRWWEREDRKSHQLVLLPRDHQKSAMIGYRVAWYLTKNPSLRILYISATSNLAQKQLKFIKDILTSPTYRFYWPEMVNLKEADRDKWTEREICVDHPKRKQDLVRDPSVFTAGLDTVVTGLHADIVVKDDIVIDENAKDAAQREYVATQAGYLASVAGTEGLEWVVGTRYHPRDHYHDLMEITYTASNSLHNPEQDRNESVPLYELFEGKVEDRGDGTGNFLWPRTLREDGKAFGFDAHILAKKKAQYRDLSKFRAQYYNEPNDSANARINESMFQYYDRRVLEQDTLGNWSVGGNRLNIIASIDFAFSLGPRSDFTSIVVLGLDAHYNYYVLDIDRFKTDRIAEYFDRIIRLHNKWGFRKIRAEVTAAQEVIVKDLKENHFRPNGINISIDHHRPTTNKEERIAGALEARYQNKQVWHYKHGNCELLEKELVSQRPPHDDIKDALATCMEVIVAPTRGNRLYAIGGGSGFAKTNYSNSLTPRHSSLVSGSSRFGGGY